MQKQVVQVASLENTSYAKLAIVTLLSSILIAHFQWIHDITNTAWRRFLMGHVIEQKMVHRPLTMQRLRFLQRSSNFEKEMNEQGVYELQDDQVWRQLEQPYYSSVNEMNSTQVSGSTFDVYASQSLESPQESAFELNMSIHIFAWRRSKSLERLLNSLVEPLSSRALPQRTCLPLYFHLDAYPLDSVVDMVEEFQWNYGTKTVDYKDVPTGLPKVFLFGVFFDSCQLFASCFFSLLSHPGTPKDCTM
jgi:hypothetical protein